MTRADVLIVGAGGSGAVVAARLSENPDRQVVLLESGHAASGDGTAAGRLLRVADSLRASVDPRTSWTYRAELVPGRSWDLARGRALGGSTAVNAGYFVPARPDDLAHWQARLGWSPAAVLDAYRRAETDRDHPDATVHGSAGPIQVQRPDQNHPLTRALVAAAASLGLPEIDDVSAQARPSGVGALPRNVIGGERWDTGRAYLAPARPRPNLRIVTGAQALHVEIRRGAAGGAEATGVTARLGRTLRTFEASEIVLCAGAIGTAHLLLLSGIGPAADLERLDRAVVVDLPVGRATSDHPQVNVPWSPHPATPPAPLALASLINSGDLELLPLLMPTAELLGRGLEPATAAALDLLVADQAPEARGTLTLDAAAPTGAPVIRSGYLETERDRATLRDGVRLGVSLLRAASGVVHDIVGIGERDLDSDGSLDAWIRGRLGTALHLTGTAQAGPAGDPGAVTDTTGHVLGVGGLRIADLSILPRVPSRGPAATAVMLGELLAEPAATLG